MTDDKEIGNEAADIGGLIYPKNLQTRESPEALGLEYPTEKPVEQNNSDEFNLVKPTETLAYKKERTASTIAIGLLVLFFLQGIAITIFLLLKGGGEIEGLLQMVLSPTTTLLAAATGYYFAKK